MTGRSGRARETSGFTLIELMIVVVIIAVLATVAIVAYTRHLKSGRLVDAQTFISVIQARQETYFQANGVYSDASGGGQGTSNFYPTFQTGEPVAKNWDTSPSGDNLPGWYQLGAAPEKRVAYFQFNVRASWATDTPPHKLHTQASALGIPAQPQAIDAGPNAVPWYYIMARGNLDGQGSCGTPPAEGDCTILWSTSSRAEIVLRGEGK
jgi:prepilin-type N-terminal cleavage/methylation domain-containing protein